MRILRLTALVSAILLLNAVTTLLFLQTGASRASAGGSSPCVAGDANGDGFLDIADPIALLQHLFDGGPAPVACAQTPASIPFLWAQTGTGAQPGANIQFTMFGENNQSIVPTENAWPLPRAGVLRSLRVTKLPGFATDVVVTLYVDGAPTALALDTATGIVNDLDTVPVQAGDLVTFRVAAAPGTNSAVGITCLYE